MFGGVKSLTVLYIYAGPEYSTNAYTYTCPNDGYYDMVAGGRVMDGAYITKNSVTQSVTKSNGGYDCFVFRSVFSVKSGDKIASSCSGHGSNGCMVKADLIAY